MTEVVGTARATALPGSNLVVSSETTIASTKATVISVEASSVAAAEAASIAGSLTTKASVAAEASVSTKAASITEATSNAIRLIVSVVVPVDLVRVLRLELLEEVRNLLLGLDQDLAEVLANVFITIVEERRGLALVADTSCTADAVDVLGDAVMLSRGQIVVDDVLDVGDIEAASSNTGSDEERAPSSTEGAPCSVSRWLCRWYEGTYRASSRSRWVRSE